MPRLLIHVQCLSHTPLLWQYFASGDYIRDVNVKNPLGRGGKIAHAFAGLMHAMHSGRFSKVTPRQVKSIVASFAPQFDGWQQHDSQEVSVVERAASVAHGDYTS